MTLLGVERRMCFSILTIALALFQVTGALPWAALAGTLLWVVARAATQFDAQLVRVLLNSNRFVSRYDPAKRTEETND